MNRWFFALLFGLAATTAVMAETQEEKFRRIDTNHDGVVSYEEHTADIEATFRAIDTKGKGIISVDDYAAYLARKTPGIPTTAAVSVARCFFKTIGPDHGGDVTLARWKAYNDRIFKWLADGGNQITFEQSKRVPPPDIIPRVVCH